ncbi:hypothetical protein I7I48_09013 [Histoplasma ohiense]|nr:hypothetical protein I7I48_09013 [Histoplasma ohiense (nom. inval.)]
MISPLAVVQRIKPAAVPRRPEVDINIRGHPHEIQLDLNHIHATPCCFYAAAHRASVASLKRSIPVQPVAAFCTSHLLSDGSGVQLNPTDQSGDK